MYIRVKAKMFSGRPMNRRATATANDNSMDFRWIQFIKTSLQRKNHIDLPMDQKSQLLLTSNLVVFVDDMEN